MSDADVLVLLLAFGLAVLCCLLAGALASSPLCAFDLKLTDDEQRACDGQGGCLVVTRVWLLGRLQTAQAAGEQAAAQACRDRT